MSVHDYVGGPFPDVLRFLLRLAQVSCPLHTLQVPPPGRSILLLSQVASSISPQTFDGRAPAHVSTQQGTSFPVVRNLNVAAVETSRMHKLKVAGCPFSHDCLSTPSRLPFINKHERNSNGTKRMAIIIYDTPRASRRRAHSLLRLLT